MFKKLATKTKIIISFGSVFFLFLAINAYLSIKFFKISTFLLFSPTLTLPKAYLAATAAEVVFFLTIAAILIVAAISFASSSVSRLEKKASEADRAKDEFVSMVSHQLRSPLSNVNWYTEMLLAGDAGKINKNQKKYLEEVYSSNQRMVELVNALLNVDLGSFAVEPEPMDFREISDSALADLVPQIKNKKLKIEKNYQKDLPVVKADPRLLRIVFHNLLSNSIKYTPEGRKITIGIGKERRDLVVSIADDGYGIPKSQHEKVFTRLFRADNVVQRSEGTGLGLYIVKAIMDQSGGRVWFESEEGKGTAFHFAFPLRGMKKKKGTRAVK
jgi:signal transduction histidine kinase